MPLEYTSSQVHATQELAIGSLKMTAEELLLCTPLLRGGRESLCGHVKWIKTYGIPVDNELEC